jgi:hypothetical protein
MKNQNSHMPVAVYEQDLTDGLIIEIQMSGKKLHKKE